MLSTIKDRFLRLRLQRDEREIKIGFILTAIIIIVIIANVTYLNLFILSNNSTPPKSAATTFSTPTSAATNSAVILRSSVPIATPQFTTPPPSSSTQSNTVKDYYINLGSGINQSTDWADVQGTFNTIDISQYQNIKEVHLETNINVPTANGTVSVRLFNKTNNYAVWNSDRTVQSEVSGSLIISRNIIYDKGPKLYSVQMMSQLGVSATLVQARIHIIAQ